MRTQLVLFVTVVAVTSADRKYPDMTIYDECLRHVDVAVIGAGAAGAYAAYRLRNQNLKVKVVELTDTVGGRHLTTSLPAVPGFKLELGAGIYSELDVISQRLVAELGLTAVTYQGAFGEFGKNRYFLRGRSIKQEDLDRGVQLPYVLTPEERQNQGRLVYYYFQKLTGVDTNRPLTEDERLRLKVKMTNRRLYQYQIDEALDLVASPDGKLLFKAIAKGQYATHKVASALLPFIFEMDYNRLNSTFYRLKEGMDALPKRLIERFLLANKRNSLTLNRKLEGIQRFQNLTYILQLKHTKTKNNRTVELGPQEFLCAERIILALPKYALDHLQWSVIKDPRTLDALGALVPVPEQKVFLVFNQPFWLQQDPEQTRVRFTDTILASIYDLGGYNSRYLLLASLSYAEEVRQLELLNLQGSPIVGSAPGLHQVSDVLKDRILQELYAIFNVSSSDQITVLGGVSKFWTLPPHVGGVTVWKAGYHYNDVRAALLKPSFVDDVYIANPDMAVGTLTVWTEGGLQNIDVIINKYFL